MFRNTPLPATATFNLIVGLGLCSLGGAMLYTYFKNRDEETTNDDAKESNSKHATSKEQKQHKQQQQQQQQQQKPTEEISVQLEVLNAHVPLIVGRSGSNLIAIEELTTAKIIFRDKNELHKICVITGIPDAVKKARSLLLKQIERSPLIKEEISVPQSVCGKIMGRCGEAMQEICRVSLAKLAIDSGSGRSGTGTGTVTGAMDKRRITITGTQSQVNIARKLIEDKIDEDEDLRRAMDEVEQHREPRRRSPTNSSSMYSSQTSLSGGTAAAQLQTREKLFSAKPDEQPMEVYVSAIASPAKFWVQLIGPQSKQLDELVDTMTKYYNEPSNLEYHKITEPYLGQIVAAIFKLDSKWYRAEIVGILPNQFNPKEVVLDLYFVDYGDSEYVAPHEVYELRTDFLTLRFQAVQCFLANTKSKLMSDKWDTQAIQSFEEYTQVANWKKLIARIVTYKERPKAVEGAATSNAEAREGSPIPGVELFDIIEGNEVNIGYMLISHGHGLPTNNDQQQQQQQQEEQQERAGTPDLTPTATLLAPAAKVLSSENIQSAEDAQIAQQQQYLLKHNIKSSSCLNDITTTSADLLNGNGHDHSTKVLNGSTKELNGNLSR